MPALHRYAGQGNTLKELRLNADKLKVSVVVITQVQLMKASLQVKLP